MLFFMVFLIFCKVTYVTNKNAGSTIFNSAKLNASCWNREDIAKLRARKAFEDVIPPPVNPEKVNKQYIQDCLDLFSNAFKFIQGNVDDRSAVILKDALCDTIGAHLKCEILPSVRFAYYAGYIPYKSARLIHDFYDQMKTNLNSQGLGWRGPPQVAWSRWSHLTVSKITIGTGKDADPCSSLVVKRDENNCIHLPSPNLDDRDEPSAIALPFKNSGLVSLQSPSAENTLLKYYTTAARCILHSSPANCRHADFVSLNNGLWHWMKRDVAPHLVDEKLYAAYGGVLRIAAAVQSYGKGLTRRNLFDYHVENKTSKKWNPWRKLTRSYFHINVDWTPTVYVILVLSTAIIICVLQACYNYMFGVVNSCRCSGARIRSNNVAYSKLDSRFPYVARLRNSVSRNKQKRKTNASNSRQSSMTSMTHKVYDLNDNTEKIMSIVMNSRGDREADSSTSKGDSEEEFARRSVRNQCESRPKSPPKIETSIAQLTIARQMGVPTKRSVARPMYSTSTLTRSDALMGPDDRLSDSAWSLSSSSTSGKSVTSTSSKSHSQRTKRSRDLAWARHVISRHSLKSGQFSSTELEGRSVVTPPTRR